MTITVVIPCLNEEGYIGRLLQSLSEQSVAPNAVHVIDCESSDNTLREAKKYIQKLPLKILTSPYRSAAAARNEGASKAKTDFILFLDADTLLPKESIAQLRRYAEKKGADFVCPRFKTEGNHPVDIAVFWVEDILLRLWLSLMGARVLGKGGAMFVRKSCHDAVGGYSPMVREFDDIDYCMKLREVGTKAVFCNKAVVTTSNRRFIQQGRFATILQMLPGNYYLVRKIVRPYMRKHGIPPKWYDL